MEGNDALDTSYFLPIDTQGTETEYLVELARNVGNYLYEYKDQFKNESGANDKLNLGIMAQQVAQVPGLNAAIIQNPNDGSLSVDANRLALSTLGYVATLARLVLDMRGIDYDRPDKEMAGNISDSGTDRNGNGGATGRNTESGTTETGRPEVSNETRPLPIQDRVAPTNETSTDDVYARAVNVGE